MEAFPVLNYFITFSSGHTERKSKWSGQFPDVTMGSLLSPRLDAITIFLHGVCDSRHRSSLNHNHPVAAAPEEILQFVRGGGGGVSSLFICSAHLSCQISRCADGGPLWPPPTEEGEISAAALPVTADLLPRWEALRTELIEAEEKRCEDCWGAGREKERKVLEANKKLLPPRILDPALSVKAAGGTETLARRLAGNRSDLM